MCVYVDVCLFTILEKGHENKSETLLNTLHILTHLWLTTKKVSTISISTLQITKKALRS